MSSEAHCNVRRGGWKTVPCSVLFLLGMCVMPLGEGQQNPAQNQAAPVSPAQPASAQPQQAAATPSAVAASADAKDQGMAAENAALLKLATELKAAVDKSSKDTLSLAVIRKAGEIEHMARGMKDKYKTSAAN